MEGVSTYVCTYDGGCVNARQRITLRLQWRHARLTGPEQGAERPRSGACRLGIYAPDRHHKNLYKARSAGRNWGLRCRGVRREETCDAGLWDRATSRALGDVNLVGIGYRVLP
jgi:hypothetical protein